ncbi:MAG: hypothetical protein OMM_00323 [Candidatus Magnetoglobus multicellularis str. Araruama]|uniref:Uncharacterized protein n=1 Tax=Candidatus Magnetoglobus multicellularis str. Araruama TaxID=890399 RepID=A0A1V1PH83_9BACT|nr:MAG: hypothetical protein OMM_00323 [Candidatus Magnetoglobus multicellularis str. Araruama]
MMTSQLKQYKDHVSQHFITDLSSKLNQFIDSIDDSKKIYDKLNDIRNNLNDVHLLQNIHDWVYELRMKIATHLTPNNKNASALIKNEISPLYKKLNNSILQSSNTVKRIFSQSNYYNLMDDMNLINKQIEQFCKLKSELDNTQVKIRFESKNKEYVITSSFINTNESLIKILRYIQVIEKNIQHCQSEIKEQHVQQYEIFANQMLLLATIFSILLICALLLRFYFEKKVLAATAQKDVSASKLKASINRKLILSAIFLLIISLSFNALLTLGSLEKLYVESTVSQYQIIGSDLQRNIDRSLRYGKKIDKFVRMNKILSDTQYSLTTKYLKGQARKQWQDIDLNVSIALPNWTMIYSTNTDFIGKRIPDSAQKDYTEIIKQVDSKNKSNWTEYKNRYYITLPVKAGESKKWAGTVVIDFNDTQIRSFLKDIFINNMKMIAGILIIGSIFLVISLNFLLTDQRINYPKF